uniref:Integrase catalytic domain-containing protein n=1 Tax=Amphimedon queenslandica TaxID=400682 RepID=A0A1X7TGR8_AMPQE
MHAQVPILYDNSPTKKEVVPQNVDLFLSPFSNLFLSPLLPVLFHCFVDEKIVGWGIDAWAKTRACPGSDPPLITSSPKYPQANGEAERAVQTVKRLLLKSEDPYLALLSYRTTPLKLGFSPAELLMGRNLRTTLPTTNKQLKPHIPNQRSVRFKDSNLKASQMRHYDIRHRAREQQPLTTGDQVWIPDQQRQGTVQRDQSTRSYTVETSAGIVRRNRRDLNILPSSVPAQEETDLPDVDTQQEDHSTNTSET